MAFSRLGERGWPAVAGEVAQALLPVFDAAVYQP